MVTTITGILGVIANIIIFQQNDRKRLLIFKLISDVLWALHYFSLSAYAGTAVAVIAIFREIVFFAQAKKGDDSKNHGSLVFFLIVSIISAVFTWKSFFSILPATGSVISIVGFWNNKPSVTRYLALVVSFLMLTYDIFCHSYIGIINEIFTLISALIGIILYSFVKNKSSDIAD